MLNIKFHSISEDFPDQRRDIDDAWIQWCGLRLKDQSRNAEIPERFYVVACSQEYLGTHKVELSDAEDTNALLLQRRFNHEQVLSFARDKFNALAFENWDDFYKKMSGEFVYENDNSIY